MFEAVHATILAAKVVRLPPSQVCNPENLGGQRLSQIAPKVTLDAGELKHLLDAMQVCM
jgi:hypothetical protein